MLEVGAGRRSEPNAPRLLTDATCNQWRDGIEGNFARTAFRAAWLDEIAPHVGSDFQELKVVLDTFPEFDDRTKFSAGERPSVR